MPTLYWAISPSRPNDIVMLVGTGLASVTAVQISRLSDSTPTATTSDSDNDDASTYSLTAESSIPLPHAASSDVYTAVKPLLATDSAVHFVVPSTLAIGVFSIYVTGSSNSNTILVNAAQAVWFQALHGGGLSASPGEQVRLFGRCIGSLSISGGDQPSDDTMYAQLRMSQLPAAAASHHHHKSLLSSSSPTTIGTDTDIHSALQSLSTNENVSAPPQEERRRTGPGFGASLVRRLTGAPLAEDEDRSLGGASSSATASGELSPILSSMPAPQKEVHFEQQQLQPPLSIHPPSADSAPFIQSSLANQPAQASPLSNWTILDASRGANHENANSHNETADVQNENTEMTGEVAEYSHLMGASVTAVAKFTPTASAQGKAVIVPLSNVSMLAATVTVPSSLAVGKWTLSIHNGYGGNAAWSAFPSQITIAKYTSPFKTTVFSVTKLGFAEALKQAGTNGGGIVQFDVGRFTFNAAMIIPPNVVIKGMGMNATTVVWNYNGASAPSYMFIGTSAFGVQDISFNLTGQHYNVFRVQPGSSGCFFTNVRIRSNPFMKTYVGPAPADGFNLKMGNIFSVSGSDVTITGCDIYAPNFCYSFDGVQNAVVSNNTFFFGGQGYGMSASKSIIMENNVIMGNSLTSTGNGISSLSLSNPYKSTDCVYYNSNTHQNYYGNNREMMTLDGAGGAYYGKIAKVSGVTVTLAANPDPQPAMPDNCKANWPGALMMIMQGTGAGQWRRVTASSSRTWTIDKAFVVNPDTNSIVLITFYRGDLLFVNNTFSDGGAVQLYGASINCVLLGNTGRRMGGFSSWGLKPRQLYWQPSMYNLFLNNTIAEGNAWGTTASGFFSICDSTAPMSMVRYNVWRRNTIGNNAAFSIGGNVEDSLFEANNVTDSPSAFVSTGTVGKAVVLRSNKLTRCPTLVSGPGSTAFKKF